MLATAAHHYQLFGLRVASEVELPEAIPDEALTTSPDVRIRLGRINLPPSCPGVDVIDGALLLSIPDVGRYRVSDGSDILVDVLDSVPKQNVRLYLLGSAMGALLHQRGLLPLHANAVEIDHRAVAFVGESGAGKSTLASWFHDRGYRVLSDDVCVVHGAERGLPKIYPAIMRVRMRRDALLASGRTPLEYDPSYSGDPEFDKFDVPLPLDESSAVPLSAVVLLKFGEVPSTQRLEGVQAASVLFEHTYRGMMLNQIGNARTHWEAVTQLLPKLSVFRWVRPRDHGAIESGTASLLDALRALNLNSGD